MEGWRRELAALLACLCAWGCANVKVEKIDPEAHAAGQDDKVAGFRYYLTRPYLVIASRVVASRSYEAVWPAINSTEPETIYLVRAIPDVPGHYPVYDRTGHLRPDIRSETLTFLPVSGTSNGGGDDKKVKKLNRDDLGTAIVRQVGNTIKGLPKIKIDGVEETNVYATLLKAYKDGPDYALNIQTQLNAGNLPGALQLGVKPVVEAANTYLGDKGKVSEDDIRTKVTDALKSVGVSSAPTPPSAAVGAPSVLQMNPKPGAGKTQGGDNNAKTPPAPTPVQDTLPFQVVFLPDFEEQYAIRQINVMAKSKYKYTFRNGTDLETVSCTYDATEVPVAIVETIGALLTAIGTAPKPGLSKLTAPGARESLQLDKQDAPFYIRVERAIEPGVYRVQKSWERVAATPLANLPEDEICGLFSAVGLPLVDSVAVINAETHTKETTPPPSPSGSPEPGPQN